MVGDEVEVHSCGQKDDEAKAYECLTGDAMTGDAALFAHQHAVQAAWRIVDPVLRLNKPVNVYDSGSWGPPQANATLEPFGGRHAPKTGPEACPCLSGPTGFTMCC
jgi:glucose-6-phosphate 1-dehydrogenase